MKSNISKNKIKSPPTLSVNKNNLSITFIKVIIKLRFN